MLDKTTSTPEPKTSKPLYPRVLAGMILAGACTAAFWIGHRPEAQSYAPAALTVDPRALDLGNLWETQEFHWRLPIRNISDKRMEIEGFSTSCSCLKSIETESFSLQPGEVRNLSLLLDLENESGLFYVYIAAKTRTTLFNKQGWTLSGNVRPVLSFSQSPLHFGAFFRGRSLPTKSFFVESAIPLSSLEADGLKENAHVRINKVNPTTFEVHVTPSANIGLGSFNLAISFRFLVEKERLVKKYLVHGFVREEIEVEPSPIRLGAHFLGACVRTPFFLKSHFGKGFRVTSVKAPPGTEISMLAGKAQYELSQKISKLGFQRNEVLLEILTEENRRFEVPLDVSYYGREAQ